MQDPRSAPAIVLCVDDQPIIGEAIRRLILADPTIQYHYCSQPIHAVERALEIKATVILQDLVMPEINGLAVLQQYRQNPQTRDIPVIILSSTSDPKTKRDAFNHGANDYLVKLPEDIELIARIHMHSRSYCAQTLLRATQRELEIRNAELRRLSSEDSLTGLANRRTFDESLQREWKDSIAAKSPLCLILLDVDCFKAFNDNYGHPGGDAVLQKVARMIKDNLRRAEDLGARYGGEEFAVLLPQTDTPGGTIVAERIRASLEALTLEHRHSKVASCVTLSVGVASVRPWLVGSAAQLIEAADKALYQAKCEGRNQVKQSAGLDRAA